MFNLQVDFLGARDLALMLNQAQSGWMKEVMKGTNLSGPPRLLKVLVFVIVDKGVRVQVLKKGIWSFSCTRFLQGKQNLTQNLGCVVSSL